MINQVPKHIRRQMSARMAAVQVLCEELDKAYRQPNTPHNRSLVTGLLTAIGERTRNLLDLGVTINGLLIEAKKKDQGSLRGPDKGSDSTGES